MASKRHGGSNGFLEVSASILLLVNLLIHLSSIEDVIAAGKERGAQRADLYGCLYFYLSKQLRMFSSRIKRFRIKFHMLDRDARALAKDLHSGVLESQGLPKSIRFDRIDVSNVIDNYYIGLPNVLSDWGPFLSGTNPCATLLGYSMNWELGTCAIWCYCTAQGHQAISPTVIGATKSKSFVPAIFKASPTMDIVDCWDEPSYSGCYFR